MQNLCGAIREPKSCCANLALVSRRASRASFELVQRTEGRGARKSSGQASFVSSLNGRPMRAHRHAFNLSKRARLFAGGSSPPRHVSGNRCRGTCLRSCQSAFVCLFLVFSFFLSCFVHCMYCSPFIFMLDLQRWCNRSARAFFCDRSLLSH